MKPQLPEEEILRADALYSLTAAKRWLKLWLRNQAVLIEPCCLALAIHVLMFPVLWALGWLLPWPKSPVTTTIIEFDLQKWPLESKPKKVIDVREPELNQ